MSQSLKNGPKLRFWANFDIIMLIMRERDFSRACVFFQMLINTLYLLNMRYGTGGQYFRSGHYVKIMVLLGNAQNFN